MAQAIGEAADTYEFLLNTPDSRSAVRLDCLCAQLFHQIIHRFAL
jgi:hypothetical protein